jgi:hypothetical protein
MVAYWIAVDIIYIGEGLFPSYNSAVKGQAFQSLWNQNISLQYDIYIYIAYVNEEILGFYSNIELYVIIFSRG